MLIGSSGRAGCCVILEHAVLSRVLKADVLDMKVCVRACAKRERLEERCVSGIFKCVVRLLRSM